MLRSFLYISLLAISLTYMPYLSRTALHTSRQLVNTAKSTLTHGSLAARSISIASPASALGAGAGAGSARANAFSSTARYAGIFSPFALFSSSSSSSSSAGQQAVNTDSEMSGSAVKKSESEWQAQLSPEQVSIPAVSVCLGVAACQLLDILADIQFRVIRQKGTERPGSHPYDKKSQNDEGVYRESAIDGNIYASCSLTFRLRGM